jgi:hypothetical protein
LSPPLSPFVTSKICFPGCRDGNLFADGNFIAYALCLKKKLSIILVILLTILLIAMVIWVFDKRIETIENKMNSTAGYFNAKKFDSLF